MDDFFKRRKKERLNMMHQVRDNELAQYYEEVNQPSRAKHYRTGTPVPFSTEQMFNEEKMPMPDEITEELVKYLNDQSKLKKQIQDDHSLPTLFLKNYDTFKQDYDKYKQYPSDLNLKARENALKQLIEKYKVGK